MSKMIKSKILYVVIFVLDNSKEGNLSYWWGLLKTKNFKLSEWIIILNKHRILENMLSLQQ
jgi:hypothetical protein